jgi:hypothetical protein
MSKDKNKPPSKGAGGKKFYNSQPSGDVQAALVEMATNTLAAVAGAYAGSAVGKWGSLVLGLGFIAAGQYYDVPAAKAAGAGMLVGSTFEKTDGTFGENAKANTNAKLDELKSRVMPSAATSSSPSSTATLKGVANRSMSGLHGTGDFTRHSVSQQVLPAQSQVAQRSYASRQAPAQMYAEQSSYPQTQTMNILTN